MISDPMVFENDKSVKENQHINSFVLKTAIFYILFDEKNSKFLMKPKQIDENAAAIFWAKKKTLICHEANITVERISKVAARRDLPEL